MRLRSQLREDRPLSCWSRIGALVQTLTLALFISACIIPLLKFCCPSLGAWAMRQPPSTPSLEPDGLDIFPGGCVIEMGN